MSILDNMWDNTDFNRGRMYGRKEGVIIERERIIKIIESEPSLNGFAFRDSGVALSEHLVALIKGENK